MELSTGCVIRNRFTGSVRAVGSVYTEKTTGIKYVLFLFIDDDRRLNSWKVSIFTVREFEHFSKEWENVYV